LIPFASVAGLVLDHADARAARGAKVSVRAATAKEHQALTAALERGGYPASEVSMKRPGVSVNP
jgi:hypothetical protein